MSIWSNEPNNEWIKVVRDMQADKNSQSGSGLGLTTMVIAAMLVGALMIGLGGCAVTVPVSFLNFGGAGHQEAKGGPAIFAKDGLIPPEGMRK